MFVRAKKLAKQLGKIMAIKMVPGKITLATGEFFFGQIPDSQQGFCPGEVVFNTGMVGYIESLTDPSYTGQILLFTYPLIGNYGVPAPPKWESSKIHLKGVILSEMVHHYSNPSATKSLLEWLIEQNIPFITDIDTRALTIRLRSKGVIPGIISPRKANPKDFENFASINWVQQVSIKEPRMLGSGKKKITVIDCGIKENILRCLMQFPLNIKQVPYDYDYSCEDFDGIFISNGPGDPMHCQKTIAILKKAIALQKPIFGICLGTQLLALAAGASTYKLPFGHRSHNQPCMDLTSSRCYLTSQNHTYAVDEETLPADWQVSFRNLNDQSVEGIAHKNLPFFAVQFHPEAAPGPCDTQWLFQKFYGLL